MRELCGSTSARIKSTGHPRKRLMYFAHCLGSSFGSNIFLDPVLYVCRPTVCALVPIGILALCLEKLDNQGGDGEAVQLGKTITLEFILSVQLVSRCFSNKRLIYLV